MTPEVRVVFDVETLTRVAATEFARTAIAAVGQKGCFTVSLAGGSTPRALYSMLATNPEFRSQIPWEKWFFFWGDERHVPPEHPESNFRMAREAMLLNVPVAVSQIFRISGELPEPSESAQEYERILSAYFRLKRGEFPRFDLSLLGMGPDGDTASLFPGTSALNETEQIVVNHWVAKFNTHRITLTVPVFNNSVRVMFLVSGEDKAPALRAVLEGAFVPSQLPAQLIRPHTGLALWLVDRRAANLLRTTAVQEVL